VPPLDVCLVKDKANNVYFEYKSVASIEAVFNAHKGNVAGVFATPFRNDVFVDQTLPDAEFARAARRPCEEHDALLIVDDVRTGLRVAREAVGTCSVFNPI
jgi:glutamate-1-semialdehyde 2,1-aminomutase